MVPAVGPNELGGERVVDELDSLFGKLKGMTNRNELSAGRQKLSIVRRTSLKG